VTCAIICSIEQLKDTEAEHTDPEEPIQINHKNWAKTIELIQDYLRLTTGIPLSYVVRNCATVPNENNNPPENHTDTTNEMIARALILDTNDEDLFVHQFLTDNNKVWDIIAALTRDDKCWSYVKPHKATCDGRGAFETLYNHYLGTQHINTIGNPSVSAKHLTNIVC